MSIEIFAEGRAGFAGSLGVNRSGTKNERREPKAGDVGHRHQLALIRASWGVRGQESVGLDAWIWSA